MNPLTRPHARRLPRRIVGGAVALGVVGAAVLAPRLVGAGAELDGSLDAVPYAMAQALEEAEANASSTEIIQLNSTSDTPSDDGTLPSADDVASTVGDIASTVGDTLVDVGRCLLDQLRDDVNTADADDDPCADLLPTDLGFPPDFDVPELDLSDLDLPDLDLPDLDADDLDRFDLGTEVRDVVADLADDVVEFVEEMSGSVRDRFDTLFGS